jgi:hypothetical protein
MRDGGLKGIRPTALRAREIMTLQHFDPVWCGKIMKYRAVGSVVAVLSAVVIMLAFDRPEGWTIPGEAGSSLWTLIILIVGPAAIVAVYQARNWDAMAQRIMQGKPKPQTKFPPTPFERMSSNYETDPQPSNTTSCFWS